MRKDFLIFLCVVLFAVLLCVVYFVFHTSVSSWQQAISHVTEIQVQTPQQTNATSSDAVSADTTSLTNVTPPYTEHSWDSYKKPSPTELKQKLTPLQYYVTQEEGTEVAFNNEYEDNHDEGIYVDVVSGEPLFSSKDKYDSATGWPSFVKPLIPENISLRSDTQLFAKRTEVRSTHGDSHLGHLFDDGPQDHGGKRYCMNSTAMLFIPYEKMEQKGYGYLLHDIRPSIPAPKPTDVSSSSGSLHVGESIMAGGIRITLIKITQDSRCGEDVVCIQAGSVTAEVQLQSGTDIKNIALNSGGEAYSFDSKSISIESVSPAPVSSLHINQSEYVLQFKVEKS